MINRERIAPRVVYISESDRDELGMTPGRRGGGEETPLNSFQL